MYEKKTRKKNYYMQELDKNIDFSKFNWSSIWYVWFNKACLTVTFVLLTQTRWTQLQSMEYKDPVKSL